MEPHEPQGWRRWKVRLNALLVIAALLIVAGMVWGFDMQDLVVGWTPESKKLAMWISAPTRRLYANQMVENPYVRYGVTEDIRFRIVPPL